MFVPEIYAPETLSGQFWRKGYMMNHTEKIKPHMLLELAKNDLKSRYSSSMLGILWAFAMPLTTILVFWFVFQIGFRNPPVEDVPYILWFVCAYIPWIFFTDTMTTGCNCLVEYSYLVKKIRFNVTIIPVVKVVSACFIHGFFVAVLLLMRMVYRLPFDPAMLQIFYYSFAAGVLSLGLVYMLSAFTVFFKDTSSLVNIIVQIGFWVTPIMWNEETMLVESVRKILSLNPMHYVVTGYRDCFLSGGWFWEKPGQALYFWAVALGILVLGIMFFRKLQPFFADEV